MIKAKALSVELGDLSHFLSFKTSRLQVSLLDSKIYSTFNWKLISLTDEACVILFGCHQKKPLDSCTQLPPLTLGTKNF